MNSIQWIPTLMFVTLAAAAGFGLLALLRFLERRGNREIAGDALVGSSSSRPGALPEIAGLGAVAVVAMALLVTGYNMRGSDVVVTPGTASPSAAKVPPGNDAPQAAASDRMTNPPKERANPAEKANPPTQYEQGSGSPASPPPSGTTTGAGERAN